jgi:5-formyltetrahydrofolate cyclo-ligase
MSPWEAAAKEGAAKAGRKVAASELPSVDLFVCGSVAVNRQGARIGKGGGFSDLEVAFLVEAGAIRPDTVLATTVHPLQVVDEPLPETIHDFRVDLIVTSHEAIWCAKPHRPPGILWEHLDQDKIAEVPALAAMARLRAVGVPDEVGFATKLELAARMLTHALDAGVPAGWVTGDEVYGNSPGLRAELEVRGSATC